MKNKLIIVIAAVCAVLCGAAAFIVTSRLSDTSTDENASYVTQSLSPEEQEKALEELYEKGDLNFGRYVFQEKVITGEISADAPRLDLKTVKRIIADNERIRDILDEFAKVQQYPDFVGGSGLTFMFYYLDKEKNSNSTEAIEILVEQGEIFYTKYAADGTLLSQETLREFQPGR